MKSKIWEVQAKRDMWSSMATKEKYKKRSSSYPYPWRMILSFIFLGNCCTNYFYLHYALMKTTSNELLLGIPCQTQPHGVINDVKVKSQKVDINENNTISILSFSNGQYWCNQNAFWNAYYQIRPPGIEMIELLFYETSNEPSQTWLAWAEKYKYNFSDNGSASGNTHFSIQYHWYNGSEPNGSELNPRLGEVRNQATKASNGYLLVNMDNDDIYHPNYISYALHHLQQNPTWMNLAMPCHASTSFNPDGTYSINYCDSARYNWGQRYPRHAHIYSTYKIVFTEHECWWGRDFDAAEEHAMAVCMYKRNLSRGQVNTVNTTTAATAGLGNSMLLIKTKSPLSITNQMFYERRELFNRLSIEDTSNLILAMEKYYQDIHELQRPTGKAVKVATSNSVAAAPGSRKGTAAEDSAPFSTTVSLPERSVGSWKDFQYRHPKYLRTRNYPLCEGFSSMLGVRFLPTEDQSILKQNVTNSKSCCELCQRMSNSTAAMTSTPFEPLVNTLSNGSDAVHSNYCGAFTYNAQSKTCLLGLGKVSYTPWTVLTFESGIRINPTCPDCGKQLDGIPLD